MRDSKFNFQEERRLVDTSKMKSLMRHTVSVNGKYSTIRFSIDYIKDNNLDNTFIKFYADPAKKAIAWKILHEVNPADLSGYRKLKMYVSTSGKYSQITYQLGIGKLLEALGVSDKVYPHVVINKYKPQYLEDELHYIELQ